MGIHRSGGPSPEIGAGVGVGAGHELTAMVIYEAGHPPSSHFNLAEPEKGHPWQQEHSRHSGVLNQQKDVATALRAAPRRGQALNKVREGLLTEMLVWHLCGREERGKPRAVCSVAQATVQLV